MSTATDTVKDDQAWIGTDEVKSLLGGISTTTLWRYRHDPFFADLRFPAPMQIGALNRWKRADVTAFRARMETSGGKFSRKAIAERTGLAAK